MTRAQKRLPFASPEQLKHLQLPLPNRTHTPKSLPPLDIFHSTQSTNSAPPAKQHQPLSPDPALQGYRALYGLTELPGTHTQGVLSLAGFKIHVQLFEPDTVSQGTVWLLHGYLEHSALYQPIILEILQQGFSVIAYDLPGHGLSDGKIASIQEFADYQRVLDGVREWAVAQPAGHLPLPWLGIGQSTGGAIWMDHCLRRAARHQSAMVSRLLLLSPLVRPAKSAWWHNALGLALVKQVKRDVPRLFRRNNHNPEFLRFVRLSDPLQPRVMGMDWIVALTRWIPLMEMQPPCRMPIWLAQGARDQTVDWRYNHEFIRRKFRLQTTLILEEGSHQLINERADIRHALTAFIPAFLHADGST